MRIAGNSEQNILAEVVVFQDQTNMARAVVTIKLMTDSTDTDMKKLEAAAQQAIESKGGEFGKSTIVPIAFGLMALEVIIIIDEKLGSEIFENALGELEHVSSATVTDFRRALG